MTSKAYRENLKGIIWNHEPAAPAGRSRSRRAAHIISDELPDGVVSQATGKVYTSKAKLRQEYRELGFIEVGNDPARNRGYVRPKIDRQEVHETLQRARARFERGERADGSPRRS